MHKKDKKIIKRGLILAAVILVLFFSMNELSRFVLKNDNFDIMHQIDLLPEESLDLIIVGNSHAKEGINADYISDVLDISAFNFAFAQQQSPLTFYILEKLFRTQTPDVVVLEAYSLIQYNQGGYDFIPLSQDKIKYYQMASREVSFDEVFLPVLRNHNFWANEKPFSHIVGNIIPTKKNIEPDFSVEIMSDEAIEAHLTEKSKEKVKLLFEYRFANIQEINELCRKNGAQLVICMVPLYKTLVDILNYDVLYYDKIKSFCDKNDIFYYDFNRQSGTDWTYKYFREQEYTQNNHLNSYGQILVTAELADFLADAGYFSIHETAPREVGILDFMDSVSADGSLLIVDDCPKPINPYINGGVVGRLKSFGIDAGLEKSGGPEIYLVSDGAAVSDYVLPEDFVYDKDGVTLCEISGSGEIVKRAVARWDEFDTAIIR